MIKCSVPSAASVAPFGGTKALLTPDPMALAFPTNGEPVIIDISASFNLEAKIIGRVENSISNKLSISGDKGNFEY